MQDEIRINREHKDRLFRKIFEKKVALNNLDIYSSKKIPLPLPRYYVFYNGTREMPEESRMYLTDSMEGEAVETAVDSCIAKGILRDILLGNKAEVTKMILEEYDENLHISNEKEISYQEGVEDGREEERQNTLKANQRAEEAIQRAEEAIQRAEEANQKVEIFRLKYQVGKSDEEIAQMMDLPLEDIQKILRYE